MFDVTTIGEVMLRMSVPAGMRLDQAAHLDLTPGGAETNVTGSVKLELYKGNISVVSRSSDLSLYSADLSSFTMGESYDQKDAAGFIKILGLPARVRAQVLGKAGHGELVK